MASRMNLRSEFQEAYQHQHCWRCKRYTPCLMRDMTAKPISNEQYCAVADLTNMHPMHICRRRLFAKAGRLHAHTTTALPHDATLRITGPVADGFWVRALVVLAHAQWAQYAGLQHFSVAYSSPADAYLSHSSSSSSSDGDVRHAPRLDGWTSYFEPIERQARSASPLLQLDCSAAARAWEQYANYAENFTQASLQCARRISLVATLPLRPRAEFRAQAEAFWSSRFGAKRTVLGVHLRGTDQVGAVAVAKYLPLIAAFLCRWPSAAIFVATDDKSMLAQLRAEVARRWPSTQLEFRDVLRGSQKANGQIGLNPGYHAHLLNTTGVPALGPDVLIDTLLLARSSFLLKSRSSVSEFAILWEPRLARHSYDFSLLHSPLPPWVRACSSREELSKRETRSQVRVGAPRRVQRRRQVAMHAHPSA